MSAPTIDAAAVWPSGRVQVGRAKIAKVQGAADAIASLRAGAVCVYVAREDVEQVRAVVRKEDAERVRNGEGQ